MAKNDDVRKGRGTFDDAADRPNDDGLPDEPAECPARHAPPPDTGLLYSVDDIANLARVRKVLVVRLCLAGHMPEWNEIQGRRYWDRRGAIDAVATAIRAGEMFHPPRKIA